MTKRTSGYSDDLDGLVGPSNAELRRIENGDPISTPPVFGANAVVAMTAELIPERPHHPGADDWASHPDGQILG